MILFHDEILLKKKAYNLGVKSSPYLKWNYK